MLFFLKTFAEIQIIKGIESKFVNTSIKVKKIKLATKSNQLPMSN